MVRPLPLARTDNFLPVALLMMLSVVACMVALGRVPILPLPTLNGAESWALETVTLAGLCAWYAASLSGRTTSRAANDNRALGRGVSLPASER